MATFILDHKRNSSIKELIEKECSLKNYFISLEITTNIKHSDIKDFEILRSALFISIVWSGKLAKFKMQEKEFHLRELFDLLKMLKDDNISALLHLTCFEMNFEKLKYILEKLPEFDIQDILALRGDGTEFTDFRTAIELMNAINNETSMNYFNIAVAGYPQGHPESTSVEQNFEVLLKKVNAGAQFVITQFFFEAECLIDFVEKCHQKFDVHIPIIPGILLAPSFESLNKISEIAKVPLPAYLIDTRDMCNDEFQKHFITFVVKLVSTILEYNYKKCKICNFKQIAGVHFFTLNDLKMASRVCALLKAKFEFYCK